MNSSTPKIINNKPVPKEVAISTNCPYHKVLNYTKKLQLNPLRYLALNSLWRKIQLLRALVITLIIGGFLAFGLSKIATFSLIMEHILLIKWSLLLSIPILSILYFSLKDNLAINFFFRIGKYGLKHFQKAYFETFASVEKAAFYKSYIFWGNANMVSRDENIIKEVLGNSRDFKRVSIARNEYLPFNEDSVLGANSDEKWLKYRKAFANYFSVDYKNDVPQIRELTQKAIANWKEKGQINLLEELFRLVVEIRGEVFFQTSFGCLDNPDLDKDFSKLVNQVLQAPVFVLGANPEGIVETFHKRVIQAIEASSKPGSVGYICKTKFENGEFTSEEAIQNASMFLLAQAPTMVLFWILYRAAQSGNAKQLGENPTLLIQHIKEELRIHPGVHNMFSRVAQKDTQIDGVQIKKGTQMMPSPLFVHHNPKLWHQASKFQADRWEVKNENPSQILCGKTDKLDENSRPEIPSACPFSKMKSGLRYLPFGHGKHRCQGRKYAVEEIFAVCQEVFQSVDLSVWKDSGLLNLPIEDQMKLNIYNCPKEEVRLVVG